MASETADEGRAGSILVELLAVLDVAEAPRWASALLFEFGTVGAILSASPHRLRGLIGAEPAALLAAHHRATLFALRERSVRGPIFATRYELIEYLHYTAAHAREESLRVFFLNLRRELIAEEIVAQGGVDAIAVEPRRVLARALELGATGLILVHNHPSGDPAPSAADRHFTQRLATAGAYLGIRLHDHLILARDGHAHVPFASEMEPDPLD